MQAFSVAWREEDVARLLDRVASVQLPVSPEGAGWSLGCDVDFVERMRRHWLDRYDWRAAVEELNAWPQFIAEVEGLPIHFTKVEGEGARRPLLLTHGWPGSHYEFYGIVEALAFPSKRGGSPDDAFDLIIPSLPGYGFSGKPKQPVGQRETARLWNRLVTETLGYPQYLAQGGDWGSIVTSWLGVDHGASVRAIHLNMLPFRSMEPPRDAAEAEWMQQVSRSQGVYGAYAGLQMTKPQSLAMAAADNPLGQAAWIVERFHDWADLGGREVDEVFGMDHLLTNIMIYVMTGSFASSLWYYAGLIREGIGGLSSQRCETPTAYAAFPGDALLLPPPRARAEISYAIDRWTPMPRGGHFAAMEEPDLFVDDLRAWAKSAWA